MKIQSLKVVLRKVWETNLPLLIEGPPGVGKSDAVRQVAQDMGLEVIDVRASLLDPVDLRGIPVPDLKRKATLWLAPGFLPREGRGVLFFDEIGHATQMVQNALFQLFLDRALGEYQLAPGWRVVAAANRVEDRAGSFALNAGLTSRVVRVTLEADLEEWQQWALENHIVPEIRSFLRYLPKHFHNFNPTQPFKAFPCPRTWAYASTLYREFEHSQLLHAVMAGCVGDEATVEFMAYLKLYSQIPSLEENLKNPDHAPIPEEPSLRYAVVGMLVEKLKRCDVATTEAIARYLTRFPPEFVLMGLIDSQKLKANSNAFFRSPAITQWLKKNGSSMIEVRSKA